MEQQLRGLFKSLIVAMIAATLTLQSTATAAGEPSPLVANLPSSPVARDFLHSRCQTVQVPQSAEGCYVLLLPYAASVNGSGIRAARAAVTVMVAELGAYLADLRKVIGTADPLYDLSSCIQLAEEGTDGRSKEPLAKLARLEADKQQQAVTEQDVADVKKWLGDIIAKSSQCRLFEPDGVLQAGVDMPRQENARSSIDTASALVNATVGAQSSSSPAAAAANSTEAGARDFINTLCGNGRECFNLLAPYAVAINRSNFRALRSGVTVVVTGLQALDKSVVDFNRTDGQHYELGPCMKVIHEAAIGGKQQLAELDAAGDDGKQADLPKLNTWYQGVKAKIQKCDYDINDVPKSYEVLTALAAVDGLVSGAASRGGPK